MNLEGLRVIELSHWIAGPLCCQILGEWGAEVIKVEKPGSGDITRSNFPKYKGESLYYRNFNRDKKSVTLDVADPAGRNVLLDLLQGSDVFVTNMSMGYLKNIGLGHEMIPKINEKIIACYISGFGLTGKYKDKKALDMVMQAMSGLMAVTGEAEGKPLKIGTVMGDYIGSYHAVMAILLALNGRLRSGKGQIIDLSITDCLISGLEWRFTEYMLTGKTAGKTGNRRVSSAPCNLYSASDGYVYIAASGQSMFERLAGKIGDPALKDARFSTNELRVANQDDLDWIINQWAATMTKDQLMAELDSVGVPNGPILSVGDLVKDEYFTGRKLMLEVEDPVLGTIPLLSSPIKMTRGYREKHLAPPVLGQNNKEVYGSWLGWDEATLEDMAKKGVI